MHNVQRNNTGNWKEWKKVMWSNESKFTLFQSDGHIRVRGQVDEAMPSAYCTSL